MNEHEQKIRERAHAIWEREGRPEGREQEHWDRAERELRAEGGLDRAGPAGATDAPVSDVTPPTDPAGGATAPKASPAAGKGRTGGGGKAESSTGSAAKERTRRRSVGPDA